MSGNKAMVLSSGCCSSHIVVASSMLPRMEKVWCWQELNALCMVLMEKLFNSVADRVRIETGVGNGCTVTRGLSGQG